jgi:hypothetical protein
LLMWLQSLRLSGALLCCRCVYLGNLMQYVSFNEGSNMIGDAVWQR